MEFGFALTAHSLNSGAGRSSAALLRKKFIRINGIALDLPQLKQNLIYQSDLSDLSSLWSVIQVKRKLQENLCIFFYFIIKLYHIEKTYS